MQINSIGRRVRTGAAVLAVVLLGGCSAAINDSVTGSVQSAPAGSTAGLGVTDIVPARAQVAKVPALAAGRTHQVRTVERIKTPESEGYRIGPQDVLDISVYQAAEFRLQSALKLLSGDTCRLHISDQRQIDGAGLRHLYGFGEIGGLIDGNIKHVLRANAIAFVLWCSLWGLIAFDGSHLMRPS